MNKYIVLLRGVNVGGKNKISMPLLKKAMEESGFSNVSTYINSGNIIFSSAQKSILSLQKKCRQIITDTFNLDIAIAVISAKDLSEALDNAPAWWDKDKELKHNAFVVIPPATADSISLLAGEIKPEYEKAAIYGQVIFWTAQLKTFSKTTWSKFVSKPGYNSITVRNANTMKKLAQLSKEPLCRM